jgi:AcrR family transcriptional regulator
MYTGQLVATPRGTVINDRVVDKVERVPTTPTPRTTSDSQIPVTGNLGTTRRVDRRSTQRERLIAGMIAACSRHGYEGANVSRTIAVAGVSRPTFYEYFTDKHDCFLAAHRELAQLLVREIERAVSAVGPDQAVQAAIRRFVELSQEYPDRADLLTNETMAGGRAALDAHDRMMEQMSEAVERARAKASARMLTPDLPIQMVFGAGRWLLAPALRRGEHDLSALADDLTNWVDSYMAPSAEHRWSTLDPGPALPSSPHVTEVSLRPPPAIPPGRPRLSKADVARNQRERILYATANVAAAKGYVASTIADITASAGVDRRVFYKHFRDKQQAFLAIHEFAIHQVMTLAASAFFSVTAWTDRVWEAMRATTQFEATHPIITHIGHVESHAVGAPAIQRIDDSRAAFTIFLQEGSQLTSESLSRTAMEAIAGAVFEIGYRQVRRGQSEQISRLAPHATYLVLAPFMGPAAAGEFIDRKLEQAAAEINDDKTVRPRAGRRASA